MIFMVSFSPRESGRLWNCTTRRTCHWQRLLRSLAFHGRPFTIRSSLRGYEEKLGLLARFMKSGEALRKIEDMIGELTEEYRDNRQLIESLETIKSIIRGLEEV